MSWSDGVDGLNSDFVLCVTAQPLDLADKSLVHGTGDPITFDQVHFN